jgi:hypothetical protein
LIPLCVPVQRMKANPFISRQDNLSSYVISFSIVVLNCCVCADAADRETRFPLAACFCRLQEQTLAAPPPPGPLIISWPVSMAPSREDAGHRGRASRELGQPANWNHPLRSQMWGARARRMAATFAQM